MQINKLDAARRQLLAAIHLQWFLVEPLATYQLAANAAELCDGLLVSMGRVRVRERIQEVQGWTSKDISILINGPRNFAKHADRDPQAIIEATTSADCDPVILAACVDYCIAAGRSPIVIGAFVAWYAALYPSKTGAFFEDEAQKLFPNLFGRPRSQQIDAARSYLSQPVDPILLHDRRNEMTDVWRWNDLRNHGRDFRTE